jgi:hypothetical protein
MSRWYECDVSSPRRAVATARRGRLTTLRSAESRRKSQQRMRCNDSRTCAGAFWAVAAT